jgi:hypothetical protein
MLDRDDFKLIQRHVGGELTPAETVRFEALLARSPEARRTASDLAALTNGLEQGDMIEPPAEAVAEIMSRVSGLPRPRRQQGLWAALRALPARASVAFKEMSGLAAGTDSRMEDAMSRRAKLVFGLSAAAVVVLIGVYLVGYPPVEEGAATIGAAKRYQAQQMAASDVKLGDQAAQKFMQSDTFDRILRDPHARKLLGDGKFQEFFSDPNVSPAFKHSEFGAALQHIATDANLVKVFGDPEMAQAIGNDDIAAALVDHDMVTALKDESLEVALKNAEIRDAFADAALDIAFADRTEIAGVPRCARQGRRVRRQVQFAGPRHRVQECRPAGGVQPRRHRSGARRPRHATGDGAAGIRRPVRFRRLPGADG